MGWCRDLIVGWLLLACASAGAASAPATLPAGAAAVAVTPPARLYVELIVNGRATDEVVPLRAHAGALLVDAEALRRAGLDVGEAGEIDVAATPGLQATYDAASQTLAITARPELLPLQHVAPARDARPAVAADTGLLLNYDAYLQGGGGRATGTLWTEQRLFGAAGSFSNTGSVRIGGGRDGYVRYDTRVTRVDCDRLLTMTAGDLITRSLPWTSSVRLAGLQVARDLQVRPDLVTMPLPSFSGAAGLPSGVDLFVNGFRQQHADVAPGRFVLDSVPVVNGAGEATVVTTDAVGRQVRTSVPFYVSSQLLRPGLVEFAGEVGFLRRGYGLSSFAYGPAAASGTARAGLTATITGEVHAEVTRAEQLAGIGLVWSPWRLGTLNLSVSAGHAAAGSQHQWTAGYSYVARWFSVAVQHAQRSAGYRDLASFDLAAYGGSRTSDQAIASANIAKVGSVGAAFASERFAGTRSSVLSATYSRALGRGATMFASLGRDLRQGTTTAQVRLIVPFGRGAASGGADLATGRPTTVDVAFDQSAPRAGGLGVDAALATGGDGRVFGQATATWRTPIAQFQGGTAFAGGRTSWWTSATGSLLAMDGAVFAANQTGEAFAVVSTGMPGVPVSYENQAVGRTDRHGDLLVPDVVANLPTRFAIDAIDLPADQVMASVEQRVAVARGSGAVVRLPVRQVHPAVVALVDGDGQPLPVGSVVRRAGSPDAEVGYDGLVYLEDGSGRLSLDVLRRDGGTCRAVVQAPVGGPAYGRLGPARCVDSR